MQFLLQNITAVNEVSFLHSIRKTVSEFDKIQEW